MEKIEVNGFLNEPKKTAGGAARPGRLTCHEVQWTGAGADVLATFTMTAEEIADAAESRLLWTDQGVQRGIQPGILPPPPRELSLAEGYPDQKLYIFAASNADDIVEKLLRDDRVFLSPLVWNLRPGTFEAYWDLGNHRLSIYSGRIYLPDSHHRQQAILKAVRAFRESPASYPKFSPEEQFKVELYFLAREDEGNYFFDKNLRPRPTAKSKAYDLTTLDDLSLLAKKVIDKSLALSGNVNRVTDRLTSKNPQVITLSTLREMMRSLAQESELDGPEIDGLATVAATFYDLLAETRSELGRLEALERNESRRRLLVDAAVMMHGYASLMRDFHDLISHEGLNTAVRIWRKKLHRLSSSNKYWYGRWSGDLFEKQNPLWQRAGIVKPGRDPKKLTILNTGAARSECGRILKQLTAMEGRVENLVFLSEGA